MAYEKLKLAKSAMTDEIYLGRIKTLKNGMAVWEAGKRNMTQDFLRCVMERWAGYSEIITTGEKKYEITVREVKDEEGSSA